MVDDETMAILEGFNLTGDGYTLVVPKDEAFVYSPGMEPNRTDLFELYGIRNLTQPLATAVRRRRASPVVLPTFSRCGVSESVRRNGALAIGTPAVSRESARRGCCAECANAPRTCASQESRDGLQIVRAHLIPDTINWNDLALRLRGNGTATYTSLEGYEWKVRCARRTTTAIKKTTDNPPSAARFSS